MYLLIFYTNMQINTDVDVKEEKISEMAFA